MDGPDAVPLLLAPRAPLCHRGRGSNHRHAETLFDRERRNPAQRATSVDAPESVSC
jgi:hypothetical protein